MTTNTARLANVLAGTNAKKSQRRTIVQVLAPRSSRTNLDVMIASYAKSKESRS